MFSPSGFWGQGGGKKTRNPPRRSVTASGTRHNSPRGGRILGIRASTSERLTLGPLSQSLLSPPPTFCVGPTQRPPPAPPPPSPLPSQVRKPAPAGQPWLPATRALAGLRALSSCTTPIPQSRLDETNPEAVRKGRSGRRWEPAAGPGVPAPALSCSPTGSSQMGRALSLCLPRSLDRSLRPGYLGGLQDGTAREGSLCAAPRE